MGRTDEQLYGDPQSKPMPDDLTRIPARLLTTHQEPALLVDHIEELSEGAGVVQVAPGPSLDGLQQTEACAQAIAVLMSSSQYGTGGDPSAGMLIGASKLEFSRPLPANEAAQIRATQVHALGAMQLWDVEFTDSSNKTLLAGQLQIAIGEPNIS